MGDPAILGLGPRTAPGEAPKPNISALRMLGHSHPTGLTQQLLTFFTPRPQLKAGTATKKRKSQPYTGIHAFMDKFADPGDEEYQPPVTRAEKREEKKARVAKYKTEKGEATLKDTEEKWDPKSDPNATEDPYKTLFVARMSFETSESKLRREFEAYGPIKKIRIVTDKDSDKPRGYAFIEFQSKTDMKTAYKQADGRKIDGKRVVVDVERGRSVPGWKPRKLGGGLGGTRLGGKHDNITTSGRFGEGGQREEEERRMDRGSRGGYDDRRGSGGGYDRGRDDRDRGRGGYDRPPPPPRDYRERDRGFDDRGRGGYGGDRRGGGFDDRGRDRDRGGGDRRGGGFDDRGPPPRGREPGEVGGGNRFPISDGRGHGRERDRY